MARIRSIHPSLYTDEDFMGLSLVARVVLPGLWTEADDHGVFAWKPLTLKARLMPADNVDMVGVLAELERASFLRRYSVDGKEFGIVRNFRKYQRPKKPTYTHPFPPEYGTYIALKEESSPLGENRPPSRGGESDQMEDEGCRMEEESSLRSHIPAEPVPPKAGKRTRRSLPPDIPTVRDQEWAQTRWLQRGRTDLCDAMTEEIEKFRDHHTAKDTRSADWSASWRTWVGNAMKFNNRPNGTTNGQSRKPRSPHEKHNEGTALFIASLGGDTDDGGEGSTGDYAGQARLPLLAS